jgi:hypothetical protein
LLCRPVVGSAGFCGDGRRGGAEACEGSDLGGATCQTFGFPGGTLACTSSCTHDVAGCAAGFRITSPDVEVPATTEVTYCYYFHMPNAADVAIKR